MQKELKGLNLEMLNSMHQQAHNRLHKSIRGGASQNELDLQREILTELSLAINSKLRRCFCHPAESPRRAGTDRIALSLRYTLIT